MLEDLGGWHCCIGHRLLLLDCSYNRSDVRNRQNLTHMTEHTLSIEIKLPRNSSTSASARDGLVSFGINSQCLSFH